jgi:hypothetical protein
MFFSKPKTIEFRQIKGRASVSLAADYNGERRGLELRKIEGRALQLRGIEHCALQLRAK